MQLVFNEAHFDYDTNRLHQHLGLEVFSLLGLLYFIAMFCYVRKLCYVISGSFQGALMISPDVKSIFSSSSSSPPFPPPLPPVPPPSSSSSFSPRLRLPNDTGI
eukprot:g452.t1